MNKYKNKAQYRFIPIKAAVLLFFSVKSSELFFLCFVVLALKKFILSSVCRFFHSVLYLSHHLLIQV